MICAVCSQNFAPNPRSTRQQIYCSAGCRSKSWEIRHPELAKERRLINFAKDPEKYRNIKRKYGDSEAAKAKKAIWYAANRERIHAKILSQPDYAEQQKYSKRARRVLAASAPKVCAMCGNSQGLIDAHHIKKPRSDNRIENLQWLCRSNCHFIAHGKGRTFK